MTQRFVNNFSTTVAATFGAADTFLQVASTAGLPTLAAGEYLLLTVFKKVGANESAHEVVKVTGIVANQLTVQRGIEGAAPAMFLTGDRVEARFTAAGADNLVQSAELTAHTTDTNNPHGVTAAHVGADPTGTAAAAIDAHAAAPDPHPQYAATLDAPLTFTYTGTLAAAPTAYQTAPMLPAPSGKEWVWWVSMAQIGPGVSGITFPNLEGVGSSFGPNSMAALTNLSLPALTTVGSSFNPRGMAALTSLSLPALTTVGVSFSPSGMAALTTLSVPALTTVGGVFNPNGMAALTTLSVPALTTVGGVFSPSYLAALTSLSFPALTTVGGTLNPSYLAALTSLSVPALTTVGDAFSPSSMPALTSLSFPALTTVGGILQPLTMTALTSLSLPALERIGTAVTSGDAINIANSVGALTSFVLPATLKQVGGNVTISSAALNQASVDSILIRLAALDGTNGTTAFNNRTVTITGTSSPPSVDGLAAKAVLIARGCTVTHK